MNKITLVLLTGLTLFSCDIKHGGNTNDCDSTVIDSTAFYNADADSMTIEDNVEKPKASSFEGMYYCSRTNDHYEFFENKTGVFVPSGNTSCTGTFKWKRNGKKLSSLIQVAQPRLVNKRSFIPQLTNVSLKNHLHLAHLNSIR